jgi:uncharacterized membrane protein
MQRTRAIFVTAAKCLAAIILGVALGAVVGVVGLIALCGGEDSPGCAMAASIVITVPIVLIGLTIGLCCTAEIIQRHILSGRAFKLKHLVWRCLLGIASLVGPLWIFLLWPPSPYRRGHQSHALVMLIYGVSICVALLALTVRFARPSRGNEKALQSS